MSDATDFDSDHQEACSTVEAMTSGRKYLEWPVLRLVFGVFTLGAIGCVLTAWCWRMLMMPADNGLSALFALWSLILTSFWWQIGVASLLPAVFGWLGRARFAAVLWLSLSMFCLVPTVAYAMQAAFTLNRPDTASATHDIALYSANLLYGRSDLDVVQRDLLEHRFDILLFQEVTPAAAQELVERFGTDYPSRVILARDDAFGQAVFSRLPFTEPPRRELPVSIMPDQKFPTIGITVQLGGREVDVWNVHALPPVGRRGVRQQDAMSRAIADMISKNAQGSDRPLIFGGDFNSPEAGVPIRRIAKAGARPHRYRPAAWVEPTWPARLENAGIVMTAARLLGGTRLDHILATDHFTTCPASGVGEANGSDHRPMMFFAQLEGRGVITTD